ncbi:MAG: ribosomal L7Ae/L30e/S12e/Gadd45 family protein, partial [Longimicrobiales bacterium]
MRPSQTRRQNRPVRLKAVKKSDRLALLGLARRAGKLVIGGEESRRAIRRGIARVVVLAADAS